MYYMQFVFKKNRETGGWSLLFEQKLPSKKHLFGACYYGDAFLENDKYSHVYVINRDIGEARLIASQAVKPGRTLSKPKTLLEKIATYYTSR